MELPLDRRGELGPFHRRTFMMEAQGPGSMSPRLCSLDLGSNYLCVCLLNSPPEQTSLRTDGTAAFYPGPGRHRQGVEDATGRPSCFPPDASDHSGFCLQT